MVDCPVGKYQFVCLVAPGLEGEVGVRRNIKRRQIVEESDAAKARPRRAIFRNQLSTSEGRDSDAETLSKLVEGGCPPGAMESCGDGTSPIEGLSVIELRYELVCFL